MPNYGLGQPVKFKPGGGKKLSLTAAPTGGGAVLGGSFTGTASIFTRTATGGLVLGETVDGIASIFAPDFTGALVLGELAQAVLVFAVTASGGPVLGGRVPSSSATGGGPVLGGSFILDASFAITMTGGPVLGGLQPQSGVFPVTFSGGPVLGGAFVLPGPEFTGDSSGGLVLSSLTTSQIYQLLASPAGGLKLASVFTIEEVIIIPLIAASPGSIDLSTTATITVVGQNTTFNSTAPVFSITGVSGVSITGGSLAVIDDTHATIEVVSGTTSGTATITDATSGATTTLVVRTSPPPFAGFHRDRFVRRRGGR